MQIYITVETAYNGSAGTKHFHPLYAISAIGDVILHYSPRLELENVVVITDISYIRVRYMRVLLNVRREHLHLSSFQIF